MDATTIQRAKDESGRMKPQCRIISSFTLSPLRPSSFILHPLLLLSTACCLSVHVASAQEQRADEGIFITVQKPITSAVVDHIRAKTNRALERRIRTIVYDFSPVHHATGVEEYGPCRDLAASLVKLQVNTVAFVHGEVEGHRVLPVLACKEIVMSKEAKLGNVLSGSTGTLDEDQRHFYKQLAERSWQSRAAIVRKMFDPKVEVFEGSRQGAVYYIAQDEKPPDGFFKTRPAALLPAGEPGLYSATQAREFGLCKLIKETREEVKDAYYLMPSALREDPLEGREPKAVRVVVNEWISKAVREALERRIRQAIGQDRANVIILELDCGGGDTESAQYLANFLRERTDEDGQGRFPVVTIAYVPKSAPGAATIVALGCTEIIMGKGATIGDFERIYKPQGVEVKPEKYEMVREALTGLAQEQGYPVLLARGMLDRDVEIYQVRSKKGQSQLRLMTGDELRTDQGQEWAQQALVKPRGKFLVLTAAQAKDYSLAQEIVDDFAHLCRVENLKDVRDAKLDFLYKFASFLQQPVVSVFLIMIGIACLILELKLPGVSLPGVIAAVCFVLYFWAQSHQLSGTIIMLAILLFILGLLLIGLEIFLLPGFTVPGISGVILIVVSLALATLEKKPETTQEWLSFGKAIGGVGVSLVGAVLLAIIAAWYLPSIPYVSRLVLQPPSEADAALEGDDQALGSEHGIHPGTAALLGAIGVAATTLRPAGIARFGDDFVDVVTEGSFVEAGARIQVIEIEGNRVVVKEV
jgi:membrane-bound ClpP family serine protease